MISIIVPIKNQFKIVKLCLESIERHYKNEEIVLVDDGSTETETRSLLNLFIQLNPNWKLIRHDQSLGHTKSCEDGITNTTCENIFLLNSDTILTKNSLEILSHVLDKNNDIGVVGPSTSSATGLQIISNLYSKRFSMSIESIEKIAESVSNLNEIKDIELVNGFCFAIKRSVYDKVGGFDSVLTCYGNEKELLIRIRKLGFRTVYVRNSYVHHFGKVSYGHEKIDIGRAQIDADRYIKKKHHL